MPAAIGAPSGLKIEIRIRAQALAIGRFSLRSPLQTLFARSHWKLEFAPSLMEARERLARERFPAVFCDVAQWQQTAAAIAELDRPPVVIALAKNGDMKDYGTEEWLRAIASQVFVLHADRLSASELFSLLNHAWRVCNQPKPVTNHTEQLF